MEGQGITNRCGFRLELGFESAESMAAGLASQEMAAAGADVANFATGGATIFRAPETVLVG